VEVTPSNLQTDDYCRFKLQLDDLITHCPVHGFTFRITELYRSNVMQARFYASGRTTSGLIITKAKPGESPHNFALAADGKLLYHGKAIRVHNKIIWREWINLCAGFGLKSGAEFKSIFDLYHVELRDWQECLQTK